MSAHASSAMTLPFVGTLTWVKCRTAASSIEIVMINGGEVMKRILTTAPIAALACGAYVADPPIVAPAPVYNWTGCYPGDYTV